QKKHHTKDIRRCLCVVLFRFDMYGTWSECKKGLPEQTSKKSQHWRAGRKANVLIGFSKKEYYLCVNHPGLPKHISQLKTGIFRFRYLSY
ncbi:hypothetical protein ACRZS8_001331, partial [Escherichia coli]